MEIRVHRAHQIGGCVTELTQDGSRIFVDFGSNLPGRAGDELSIEGLTQGVSRCDGVLFTHSHGDHIGQIGRINADIPLYMSATTKRLQIILLSTLIEAGEDVPILTSALDAVKRAELFAYHRKMTIGQFAVRAYYVDHSAFDAHMLLIEGGGVRILHTGDFRTHGFRGGNLERLARTCFGNVDWLVCEGTMMSRQGEEVLSEEELSRQAAEYLKRHKRVFVLCSSTNIDRIEAFVSAVTDGRPILCDAFQKKVLSQIDKLPPRPDGRYRFDKVRCIHASDIDAEQWESFLCFVRPNSTGQRILCKYGDAAVIYSMWSGYIDPTSDARDERLTEFLAGREFYRLHTSGHATAQTLKRFADIVSPKKGIIPIHTERPEEFVGLMKGHRVLLARDDETIEL